MRVTCEDEGEGEGEGEGHHLSRREILADVVMPSPLAKEEGPVLHAQRFACGLDRCICIRIRILVYVYVNVYMYMRLGCGLDGW